MTQTPFCTFSPVASVASGTFGAVGNAISVSPGTWIGSPSATQYRWLKDVTPISGATSSSYTPVSGDIGSVITPQVRRQNAVGFSEWASASNSATIVASASAPAIGVLPQQSYLEDSGTQTLDVSAFTTGTAPITYSRSPSSSAVAIASATGILSTNTANAFAAQTFTITATNAHGSGQRTVSVQVNAPATAGYYVDPSGSNSNAGSQAAPWLTLQFAVDQLVPGDTLNINNGTYGGFNVSVSGTVAQPITIQGTPGHRPVVDGRIVTGQRGSIYMIAKSNLIFRNMDVKEGRATASGGPTRHCVYVEGTSGQVHGNILFENIKAFDTDHSGFHIVGLQTGATIPIGVYRLKGITIRNGEVTNVNRVTGQEGITVGGGVEEIIVENNWIHDSNRYGVDFKLGVRKGIVRFNHIHNCAHHGIYLDCASRVCEDCYVYGNDVHDNNTTGITLTREAARDPGEHVGIRDIWIWANRFSRNLRAFQCYRHGGSDTTTLGFIENINFFHNTCVDSDERDLNLSGDSAWVNAVINGFHLHNNIFHGAPSGMTNQYTGAPGYTAGNNVTSNPSFINRGATHPDLHIPIGSTADNAGSTSWLPANALADASAWFLANATVDNKDASGVNSFNGTAPASGAYEAA
jgi:hypothetical protein